MIGPVPGPEDAPVQRDVLRPLRGGSFMAPDELLRLARSGPGMDKIRAGLVEKGLALYSTDLEEALKTRKSLRYLEKFGLRTGAIASFVSGPYLLDSAEPSPFISLTFQGSLLLALCGLAVLIFGRLTGVNQEFDTRTPVGNTFVRRSSGGHTGTAGLLGRSP